MTAGVGRSPHLTRRGVLGAGLAMGASALAVSATSAYAASHRTRSSVQFPSAPVVLKEGTPESVGLPSAPIEAAKAALRAREVAPAGGKPLFPGHVAMMVHAGVIVRTSVSGYALRYATDTTELPQSEWVAMRRSTIFDLASISKLFTSIAAVQLIEEGRVDLEAPVAAYLPEFAAAGKEKVTVKQLLTHTSGFVAWLPLHSAHPDKASRIAAVMAQPLNDPPGTVYRYSDLNLITLGVLVERLRGMPLDQVVAHRITRPLGMARTGYNPRAQARTAATEWQATPARGMVWGDVHDENAWSLDGVAGHAGVFSTIDDLAILAQAMLNGGTYRRRRILSERSVEMLITNYNQAFPGNDHGLGFELNQQFYMGDLRGPLTAGHTGYTGTSFVVDFATRSCAILLTNRVHPSRTWGSINPARQEWANGLAAALRESS